ncbi:flagellar motor stator protein MotA [Virgibacillus kekensis]|uniref:Flagellar motor stator protein MotA n=1 Tax=Virgibacillus kekensis TaxID=202261 RepID=A0ABV9DG37_9BACI
MDKTSVIGILVGIAALGIGILLKGVSPEALINPAAFIIIFVGTAATVIIGFPTEVIKNIPKLFSIIFKEDKHYDVKKIIHMFVEWAEAARKEGILSLENRIDELDDSFLTSGIQLAVDGQSPEFIRDIMMEKVDAMENRHQQGISVFTQAGTYAPTLGVLGAVVGLIAALGNMGDIEALGHAISSAFIATLFGIFSGYVLWHPFANKLKEKSKKEVLVKEIMIEGILSITNGESPQLIKDKLGSYLSPAELKKMDQEDSYAQEEKE